MKENSTPKLYEHKDLNKKLQLFYAEVHTKDGFFLTFLA